MENINQSSDSSNTAEEKLREKLKDKLLQQLTSITENYKKKYSQSHFHKIKGSPPLSQDDSVVVCDDKKSLHQQDGKFEIKENKEKSCITFGDFMVHGMEENKLSNTRHIRVQPIPWAKTEDAK